MKSKEAVEETEGSETGSENEGRMVAAMKTIAASLDGMWEEMHLMHKTLKVIAGYTEMSMKAMGCFMRGEQFLRTWEMGAVEGEQAERSVRPWSEGPEVDQQEKGKEVARELAGEDVDMTLQ